MPFEFDEQNTNTYVPSNRTRDTDKSGFITKFFIAMGLGGDAKSAQVFILIVSLVFFGLSIFIFFFL
jgi:hypothetical protein